MSAGQIFIAREITGGQARNDATAWGDETYDTEVRNDGSWAFDGTEITLPAGRFLVLYNEGLTAGGANRSEHRYRMVLGDTGPSEYGECIDGMRRSGVDLECFPYCPEVLKLTVSTTLKIQSMRGDNSTASAFATRTPNKCGIQVLQLEDDFLTMRLRTGGGKIEFGATPEAVIFVVTDEQDPGYNHEPFPDQEKFNAPVGRYLVTGKVWVETASTTLRQSVSAKLVRTAGGQIDQELRATAYLRGAEGCQDDVVGISGILEITVQQTSMELQVWNNTSTVLGGVGYTRTSLTFTRLPDTADVMRLVNTTDQSCLVDGNLDWNSTLEQGGSIMLDASDPEKINLLSDGDYLFMGNFYNYRPTGDGFRLRNVTDFRLNGVAALYGMGARYNRGIFGGYDCLEAGHDIGIMGVMAAGDYMKVYQEQLLPTPVAAVNWQANYHLLQALHLDSIWPKTPQAGPTQSIGF